MYVKLYKNGRCSAGGNSGCEESKKGFSTISYIQKNQRTRKFGATLIVEVIGFAESKASFLGFNFAKAFRFCISRILELYATFESAELSSIFYFIFYICISSSQPSQRIDFLFACKIKLIYNSNKNFLSAYVFM